MPGNESECVDSNETQSTTTTTTPTTVTEQRLTNEQLARPQNEYEQTMQAQQSVLKQQQQQQQPLVSSLAKNKQISAIKIQIQGSQTNLNGHTNYRRHISFDDSCKKDDGDEVRRQ